MEQTLSPEELRELIRLARKALWSDVETKKAIQASGVNVIPANFYSTVPGMEEIENSFEYAAGADTEIYNDTGLFDAEKIGDFLETIRPYAREFDPPLEADETDGFYWKNPAFSFSDAMAYYCVIRHFKPKEIVEIGAGYSTLVADMALKRNGGGSITVIEPYPKAFLAGLQSVREIIESPVQEISLERLVALIDRCDLCFIDSTHTVKIGSDCLWIYLKVLPCVSTETVVHVHDVYLPFGFAKTHAMNLHIYWTEQYLLYAYMLDNPRVEVLYGNAFATRKLPGELAGLMGDKYPVGNGASLWFALKGRRP